MSQPCRDELRPFAAKLHGMQFVGEKPKAGGEGSWQLYGITYLDDLRGQFDREQSDVDAASEKDEDQPQMR